MACGSTTTTPITVPGAGGAGFGGDQRLERHREPDWRLRAGRPGRALTDPAVSATITGSQITALAGGTGVEVSGGYAAASITLSNVTGGAAGIDLEGGTLTSVTGNFVVGSSGPAVLIGSSAASSPTICNNDLSSGGAVVLQNSSGATVDAAENYFSGSSGLATTPGAVAPVRQRRGQFRTDLDGRHSACGAVSNPT